MADTRGFIDWLTDDSLIGQLWRALNGDSRSRTDSRGNSITDSFGTGARDSVAGGQIKDSLFGEGLGTIFGELKSLLHSWTGYELTGAQREQNAVNEQMAQNAFQREMDFYGQRYQMAVSDMESAGLNPAMMMGGNASLGSGVQSPQASGQNLFASQGLSQILNLAIAQKQLEIDKYKADTERIGVNSQTNLNDSIIKWNESREKGQTLVNSIMDASKEALIRKNFNEADFIAAHKEQIQALRENLVAQTNLVDLQMLTEEQKAGYYLSLAYLNSASEKQILELTKPLSRLYNSQADLNVSNKEYVEVLKEMQETLNEEDITGNNFYDYLHMELRNQVEMQDMVLELTEDRMKDALARFFMIYGFTGNGLMNSFAVGAKKW